MSEGHDYPDSQVTQMTWGTVFDDAGASPGGRDTRFGFEDGAPVFWGYYSAALAGTIAD